MKIVYFPQLRKNKWQGQESLALFMNSSPGCKNKSGCKNKLSLSVSSSVSDNNMTASTHQSSPKDKFMSLFKVSISE